MKTAFLSLVALLATSPAIAGPGERGHHPTQNRPDGRGSNDSNYGYAKGHKVTLQERARWEREHQDGRREA